MHAKKPVIEATKAVTRKQAHQPSLLHPSVVKALHAGTKATPETSVSIHPKPKSRAYRLKKRAQYLKNRAARSQLNQEFMGAALSKNVAEYHARLKALSLGTH